MSRLIYVPQYPAPMRYQEWWINEFTKEFKKEYDEVIVLGSNYLFKTRLTRQSTDMFSPINEAINLETIQMNDYMSLNIRDDDTLFLADISFPGLFCNVLYHKRCPKMYAFCHATSLNKYDYFTSIRNYKSKNEKIHASMFDTIFFGSEYSMNKTGWKNGIVTYLPKPPENIISNTKEEKVINIISVCRPNIQKTNSKLEKHIEKTLGIKIHREEVNTWFEYSSLLSKSKINLISSKEDTFNYSIMDSIRCGCIPIVPNTLCFPEILPRWWRYDNGYELIIKLKQTLHTNDFELPEMFCENQVNNFFKNMIEIMVKS